MGWITPSGVRYRATYGAKIFSKKEFKLWVSTKKEFKIWVSKIRHILGGSGQRTTGKASPLEADACLEQYNARQGERLDC